MSDLPGQTAKWDSPEHVEYANKRMREMDKKTGLQWNIDNAYTGIRFRAFPKGHFHLCIYDRGDWFLEKDGKEVESHSIVAGGNFDVCLDQLVNAYKRHAMSEQTTSGPGQDELCGNQRRVSGLVSREIRKTMSRVAREKVFMVMQLGVFAHNCDNKAHGGETDILHIDFIAEAGRQDIPGSLQAAIKATETLLAALKAKVQ